MPDGPLFAYREMRRNGELKADTMQELAAEKFQSLHNGLKGYDPTAGLSGWKARLGLARRMADPPMGLYIFGGVGRGKSMLMGLFFEKSVVEQKRRVHFHEFMIEVQEKLHQWRKQEKSDREDDPIAPIADDIASGAWLLCFDEFHVVDIADAMMLGRLFEALFARGVVVVATSNFGPDMLYKDGLNRELFLPFIELIKQKLDVLHLASPTDYRHERLMAMEVYLSPLGSETTKSLEQDFAELTEGAVTEPDELEVKGRTLSVSRTARGVAWFTFEELCEQALGAGDYIAVAERYHTIVLDGVPHLPEARRNEAKRFMLLIDELYEHKANLIMGADVPPPELYTEGRHAFEFERTVSRLMEMQSKEYLDAPHGTETAS
ncbi:MAG: cell division protein ZapE [Alphaproteobacteria bacterium]|nr:cell division protein ZapE [Alphaproteobacteria bacterium]